MAKPLKPFFSIIIPALNEAKYLPHLLEDLAHQSYLGFEVIVVDGHSDDNTVAKVQEYASSLPSLKIVNSPRRHVCTQRNLGAKHARANWYIFMDADNRLPPYFLLGIKYRIESKPVDIFTTWFKPDKNTSTNKLIASSVNLGHELQNTLKPRFLLESMIGIDRKIFTSIGGFNENIDYAEGLDFIKMANLKDIRIHCFRDPVYTYSYRRLRSIGAIKFLKSFTQLGLTNLTNRNLINEIAADLYPMKGGHTHTTRHQQSKLLKSITNLFNDLHQ